MNGVLPGKGTEAEPYLIEDVYDLCNLSEYNGASSEELSYVKLTTNIDFNNHETLKYGAGYNQLNITGTNMVFDGNHKEIRNLYMKDRYFWDGGSSTTSGLKEYPAFKFNYIHDTYFVNVVMNNCGGNADKYWSVWLKATECYHCSFNILILSPRTTKVCIPTVMNECTFNFTLQGYTSTFDFGGILIKRSHIIFNFSNNQRFFAIAPNWDTCLIDGQCDSSIKVTDGRMFNSGGGSIKDCVLAIELKGLEESAFTYLGVDGNGITWSGITVVDKSVMPFTEEKGSKNIKLLSGEDIRNTSVLQGLGFPVVGV